MITIDLPTPSGHAHNKGHWRAKAGPVKAMLELDCILDSGLISGDHWEALRIVEIGVCVDEKKPGVTLKFDFHQSQNRG